ncbi:MAG: hypothetical protein K2Q97_14955, partial [Burkholderiaceae bacterium]|nr:hypothetical protein [Burkholderiaceae bacterium]
MPSVTNRLLKSLSTLPEPGARVGGFIVGRQNHCQANAISAMGTRQNQILRIFLLQGGLLGLLGSVVGSTLGGAAFLFFHAFFR